MEGEIKENINYFEFRPHYYGPFSFDLRDIIEAMIYHGWIVEEKTEEGYIYKSTDEGKEFLKELENYLKSKYPNELESIMRSVENVVKKI